jgi:hypothetical protein
MQPGATVKADSEDRASGRRARQQEMLIAALLTQTSIARAAKQVGISKATAIRWLAEPGFKAAFRSARREVLEAAIGRLQQVTTDAVKTLHASLRAKPPTVRVTAARTILEYSLRGVEFLDLEDRMSALERRLCEQDGRRS